uniref:Uncharacterized protein n=1 Tax=Nelumbo nucifera TaxID=4432 RepID=A0A822XVC1_NELNU|nr:TPA_asm: hypothetical protein HUJ06_024502 [Nelumbo nucifera]
MSLILSRWGSGVVNSCRISSYKRDQRNGHGQSIYFSGEGWASSFRSLVCI